MNNLIFNLKKFLANKNTVTIIGVGLAIFILYFGYNYRISKAIQPKKMPYALETIQPREKITESMIGYANVPPSMVIGNYISNANYIIGKYANYNTLIPAGSLFYSDAIVAAEDLPDSAFLSIPEGNIPFNFPVDIESTYGNSIFPGNYINIYFKALNEEGKIIVGKLIENIKVLAVKDSSGKHVFENTSEERVPSSIIFAVPEELHLLLRKAMYLRNVSSISAELIPVPNTEAYISEPESIVISNQYLKTFIELNTGYVPEDDLPDMESPEEEQEEDEETTE
jgi:hypothetical protein